jgi:FXSXX-COOH protein
VAVDGRLAGIETRLPDMTGWSLDLIEEVDSLVLRRILRRLAREAAQLSPPQSGFNSSSSFNSAASAP